MTRRWFFPAAALLSAAGCSEQATEPVKQYKLHGKVIRLQPEHKLVTVDHRKIEGWMEAMQMEFPARDAAAYARLKEGLTIEATVNVQDIDYWLSEIRVVAPE